MASEWREVTVDQVCSLVIDCPHSTPVWTDSGVVVIRNTYLKNGRMDLSNPSYTDEEHYQDRVRRATPQPEDLVISREAPIGEIAMIPEGLRACLGQRVVLLRPNDAVCDGRFLLYSFIGGELRDEIMSHEGTGSTVSNLRIPSLKAAKVKLPPLPVQRQIAVILSAFDDKIELNRRMNRTLEQMARALFKSWFVDFDPVRAKMRGEQPKGMDAETAALFPDELVEVDGREVPKGWELATIGDIAKQWKEQVSPSSHPDAAFAHFSIPSFDSGQQPTVERGETIKSNKFTVPDGAILVSKLNPATPRVWDTDKPDGVDFCVSSTEFIPFVAQKTEFSPLLFLTLTSEAFTQALADQASGTSNSHQRVKPSDIADAPVVLPSDAIVAAFGRLAIPILGSMKHSIGESAQLAQLRDALLPRLLSGEVDVSEWANT